MAVNVDFVRYAMRSITAGPKDAVRFGAPSAALYRKLGVHRRTEALVWGRENGFPLGSSGG